MPERLEDRTTPGATPTQIRDALDLPTTVGVTYTGDANAVQTRTRPASGALLGFPSGRDADFLMLSTGIAS